MPLEKMERLSNAVGELLAELLENESDAMAWLQSSFCMLAFSIKLLGKMNGINDGNPHEATLKNECRRIHAEMVQFCCSLNPINN